MKKIIAITMAVVLLLVIAAPVSATKPGTYTLLGGSATTSRGAWQAAGQVYKRAYDLSGGGTIEISGIDLSPTVADGNPWPPKDSFYVQFGVQEAARFWGLNPRNAVFFTLTIQGVSGVDYGYPWWYTPPPTGPEYMRSYLIQTWYSQKLPWQRNDEGEPVAFVMGEGSGFNADFSSGSNTLGILNEPSVGAGYDTWDLKFVFTPNPDGSMDVKGESRVHASTPTPGDRGGTSWTPTWPTGNTLTVPPGVIDWSGCKIFTLIANSGLLANVPEAYTWGQIKVTVP